jgi:hypothetical protein
MVESLEKMLRRPSRMKNRVAYRRREANSLVTDNMNALRILLCTGFRMPVLAVLFGLLPGLAMAAAPASAEVSAGRGRPLRPAQERPNILFIFSDDHALRTISAYAGEGAINRTPNIDRLAAEGAIFMRSFCGNSICQPSRASILTGKHSHKNGVLSNGSAWNPKQQVFPRLLKSAGYQTAMIGKWHMHPFPSDEFEYHKTLSGHGGQGRYYNPEFRTHDGKTVVEQGYSTDIITSESIEWLEGRDKDRPFLLMTQFKSPHTNVMPPLRHLELFADKDLPLPASYHSDLSGRCGYLSQTWMRMHNMSAPDVIKIGPSKGTYTLGEEAPRKRKGKKAGRPEIPSFYSYMTPEQLEKWHDHYDPLNEAWARRLAALCEGLPALRGGDRRECRAPVGAPREDRFGGQHDGHLLVRPGFLPRRERMDGQAVDGRDHDADALPDPLAGEGEAGAADRSDDSEHRLRADLFGGRRGGGAGRHAGAVVGPVVRRRGAGGLAEVALLPVPPGRGVQPAENRGRAHRSLQADPLL